MFAFNNKFNWIWKKKKTRSVGNFLEIISNTQKFLKIGWDNIKNEICSTMKWIVVVGKLSVSTSYLGGRFYLFLERTSKFISSFLSLTLSTTPIYLNLCIYIYYKEICWTLIRILKVSFFNCSQFFSVFNFVYRFILWDCFKRTHEKKNFSFLKQDKWFFNQTLHLKIYL